MGLPKRGPILFTIDTLRCFLPAPKASGSIQEAYPAYHGVVWEYLLGKDAPDAVKSKMTWGGYTENSGDACLARNSSGCKHYLPLLHCRNILHVVRMLFSFLRKYSNMERTLLDFYLWRKKKLYRLFTAGFT